MVNNKKNSGSSLPARLALVGALVTGGVGGCNKEVQSDPEAAEYVDGDAAERNLVEDIGDDSDEVGANAQQVNGNLLDIVNSGIEVHEDRDVYDMMLNLDGVNQEIPGLMEKIQEARELLMQDESFESGHLLAFLDGNGEIVIRNSNDELVRKRWHRGYRTNYYMVRPDETRADGFSTDTSFTHIATRSKGQFTGVDDSRCGEDLAEGETCSVPYDFVYTPASDETDTESMRTAGAEYLQQAFNDARYRLRNQESRAYPGHNICEMINPEVLMTIMLIENSSHAELDDPNFAAGNIGRSLVELGANGDSTFFLTVSPQDARGSFQFIKSTYDSLVGLYSDAELDPNYFSGTANLTNSLVAAICLMDDMLKTSSHSQAYENPHFEYARSLYLSVGYNMGGPGADSAIREHRENWLDNVPTEAGGYNDKFEAYRIYFRERREGLTIAQVSP